MKLTFCKTALNPVTTYVHNLSPNPLLFTFYYENYEIKDAPYALLCHTAFIPENPLIQQILIQTTHNPFS